MKRSLTALSLLALWVAALAVGGVVRRATAHDRFGPAVVPALAHDAGAALAARRDRRRPRIAAARDHAGRGRAREARDASRALVDALRGDERFRFVANGDTPADSHARRLGCPYRYLVATMPTRDRSIAIACTPRSRLALRDLASPGGFALEPLIARDPTFVVPELLERWQPAQEPRREFDVWFDACRRRARCWSRRRRRRVRSAGPARRARCAATPRSATRIRRWQ